ncbi:hypothetical protein CERSUDRAFT_72258 [Gelatoporia subvermispora B]|uniref:Uncharacterized protein n=1 Tax=Ceriporiopsis subvermispora (strain B) TaxID=914234 RepID=M2QPP3_CERS8|nr:hypothetical protein CERSUDRAFT_72258 [Gelatoporia subvermispora B]
MVENHGSDALAVLPETSLHTSLHCPPVEADYTMVPHPTQPPIQPSAQRRYPLPMDPPPPSSPVLSMDHPPIASFSQSIDSDEDEYDHFMPTASDLEHFDNMNSQLQHIDEGTESDLTPSPISASQQHVRGGYIADLSTNGHEPSMMLSDGLADEHSQPAPTAPLLPSDTVANRVSDRSMFRVLEEWTGATTLPVPQAINSSPTRGSSAPPHLDDVFASHHHAGGNLPSLFLRHATHLQPPAGAYTTANLPSLFLRHATQVQPAAGAHAKHARSAVTDAGQAGPVAAGAVGRSLTKADRAGSAPPTPQSQRVAAPLSVSRSLHPVGLGVPSLSTSVVFSTIARGPVAAVSSGPAAGTPRIQVQVPSSEHHHEPPPVEHHLNSIAANNLVFPDPLGDGRRLPRTPSPKPRHLLPYSPLPPSSPLAPSPGSDAASFGPDVCPAVPDAALMAPADVDGASMAVERQDTSELPAPSELPALSVAVEQQDASEEGQREASLTGQQTSTNQDEIDDVMNIEDEDGEPDYTIDAKQLHDELSETQVEDRRLAGELLHRLKQKCRAIDTMFHDIAASETGVTSEQMLHKDRTVTECARLGPNKDGKILVSHNRKTVAKCFEKFKEAHANDDAKIRDILLTHYHLHMLLGPEGRTTVASRKRTFHKFTSKLAQTLDTAHLRWGFESILLTSGNNPQQDDGVGYMYETEGATGFVERVTKMDQDTVVGLLRSHASHLSANLIIERTHEAANKMSANVTVATASTSTKMSGDIAGPKVETRSSVGPEMIVVRIPRGDGLLKGLRVHLLTMLCLKRGLVPPVGGQCPWISLLSILYRDNLVIINWPPGVPWPGHPDMDRSKGIAGLTGRQQKLLADAIEHPTRPLTFVADHEENRNRRGDYLVILGAPPSATSEHARGLRVFWSASSDAPYADNKGLPRRTAVDSSPPHSEASPGLDAEPTSPSPPLAKRTRGSRKLRVVEVQSDDQIRPPSGDSDDASSYHDSEDDVRDAKRPRFKQDQASPSPLFPAPSPTPAPSPAPGLVPAPVPAHASVPGPMIPAPAAMPVPVRPASAHVTQDCKATSARAATPRTNQEGTLRPRPRAIVPKHGMVTYRAKTPDTRTRAPPPIFGPGESYATTSDDSGIVFLGMRTTPGAPLVKPPPPPLPSKGPKKPKMAVAQDNDFSIEGPFPAQKGPGRPKVAVDDDFSIEGPFPMPSKGPGRPKVAVDDDFSIEGPFPMPSKGPGRPKVAVDDGISIEGPFPGVKRRKMTEEEQVKMKQHVKERLSRFSKKDGTSLAGPSTTREESKVMAPAKHGTGKRVREGEPSTSMMPDLAQKRSRMTPYVDIPARIKEPAQEAMSPRDAKSPTPALAADEIAAPPVLSNPTETRRDSRRDYLEQQALMRKRHPKPSHRMVRTRGMGPLGTVAVPVPVSRHTDAPSIALIPGPSTAPLSGSTIPLAPPAAAPLAPELPPPQINVGQFGNMQLSAEVIALALALQQQLQEQQQPGGGGNGTNQG